MPYYLGRRLLVPQIDQPADPSFPRDNMYPRIDTVDHEREEIVSTAHKSRSQDTDDSCRPSVTFHRLGNPSVGISEYWGAEIVGSRAFRTKWPRVELVIEARDWKLFYLAAFLHILLELLH